MKQAFGKWLLDIAKYLTTAVILTSIIGEIQNKVFIYIFTIIVVSISLGWGLWLIKKSNPKKKGD